MANEEWEKVSWEEKIEAKVATKPSTALEGDYVNISQMWNRDIYTFEPAPVRPLPEEWELMRIREEKRLVAEKERKGMEARSGADGGMAAAKSGVDGGKAGARKVGVEDRGLGSRGLGRGRPRWEKEEELPFAVDRGSEPKDAGGEGGGGAGK
ncbi:hypothetical protein PV05_04408 [Exophiala xenobiotica]|uniref:Uncharacterized protein n=1 Tax=Exophiala xenobiotica TaxID=348802 RepID=A0A0D2CZU4_9EURO|nr:uncharacterized protein PV05_04408 [Exophiala xenobiotica]KIW55677.1 hypothetical protein PV05_04408 [Exophiala xenobiotica]